MNPDTERFLNLKDTPARLTAEQASWLLGFSPHEIPILMAKAETAAELAALLPAILDRAFKGEL